jgi:hypothetical protein
VHKQAIVSILMQEPVVLSNVVKKNYGVPFNIGTDNQAITSANFD